MTTGWIYLLLAGVFEIGFTTSMRYLDWSLKLVPLAIFLVCSILSFTLLIAAIKTVPLGTAYAVWTGVGTAGTAVVGFAYYGEQATTLRLVFLVLLIASIAGLKAVSAE